MSDIFSVPALPGVPLLAAYSPVADIAATLLTEDGDIAGLLSLTPQWGFYLDGEPVVLCDNVVSHEYKQEFAISDHPVEQGGFASYNKVQVPFDVRFRFTTGGSVSDRAAMIQSIQAIIGDTNFYQAITPEATFDSLNFTHWNYARTATNGLGLLIIDVWAYEVRVASGSNTFQDTASPSGSSATPAGTVQPAPVDPFDANNVAAGAVPQLNASDVSAAGGIP